LEKGSMYEIKALKWAARIIKKSCKSRLSSECKHCPMRNCCEVFPGIWNIESIGRKADA